MTSKVIEKKIQEGIHRGEKTQKTKPQLNSLPSENQELATFS